MRKSIERYVLPTLLPFLGALTALGAGVSDYPIRVYWAIGTVIFVTGSAILTSRNTKRADAATEAAIEARARLATALTGAGQPLITVLGELSCASGTDYREQIAVLQDRVISIAKVQCGRMARNSSNTDHVRAVFYEFDASDPDRLLRRKFEGRNGLAPRVDFVKNRSQGDAGVIGVAQAENSVLVHDINHGRPAYLDPNGRSFRSYINVPVQAGEKRFGLLIVDSTEPGAFNAIDVRYLNLLAGLLAAGLAQAPRSRMTIAGQSEVHPESASKNPNGETATATTQDIEAGS